MKKLFFTLLNLACAVFLCLAEKNESKHLVLISFDGWGSYSVPKADMPTVRHMMDNGCYTLEKRTVLPSSSAPNWASMFMGAATEQHGYTQWNSKTPEIPSQAILKHNIFPTIFQITRDAYPDAEIDVLYEWDGIKHLIDTLSVSHHEIAPDAVNNPQRLPNLARKYIIEKKPLLLAVCFDEPDHTGHSAGHDTPEYYSKLAELDNYIAQIVNATKEAGTFENTVFILTSDHGGIGKGHGGTTMAEMQSPFIIFGCGIKNLGKFSESMMQYDVASTIAYALGVEQPQVWVGRPMKNVFK